MTDTGDIFLRCAVDVVPRALGLCDRDPDSETFGCGDRAFWHYRLQDFTNARMQEMGWLFALAHATPAPGSPFHGRQAMARWARAAWRFWLAHRNRDGSAAEAYPNERSFCATAFTAAAFVDTVSLLGGAAAWREELEAARATMSWLAARANPEVANQMAASLTALTGYAALTGDTEIADAARRRRDDVLALSDPDGGFPEYGGVDLGYQSVTMSALVRALDHGDDDRLSEAVELGLRRAEDGIGPDGRTDSAISSRGTQFIYPSAFARQGRPAIDRLIHGLEEAKLLRPSWMDDRYCIAFACDYFLAGKALNHANDTV